MRTILTGSAAGPTKPVGGERDKTRAIKQGMMQQPLTCRAHLI